MPLCFAHIPNRVLRLTHSVSSQGQESLSDIYGSQMDSSSAGTCFTRHNAGENEGCWRQTCVYTATLKIAIPPTSPPHRPSGEAPTVPAIAPNQPASRRTCEHPTSDSRERLWPGMFIHVMNPSITDLRLHSGRVVHPASHFVFRYGGWVGGGGWWISLVT